MNKNEKLISRVNFENLVLFTKESEGFFKKVNVKR